MFDKAKDPVCGMNISKKTAAATSEHKDKTFYFCSSTCKDKFDQEPMKYMQMEEKKGGCCG
ncbi:MAG TPA: YHS domain-containing protein [candidate division CPR3 bacterium]|uniref:YHS domain-containing protein n=1 Tax=candidate division CPR3 bacterium TaxID=2268181 RepID=A0A7C1NMP9_UNCC3|nr:YHS domain-containing protein [candidate division CPR3 bacterium]